MQKNRKRQMAALLIGILLACTPGLAQADFLHAPPLVQARAAIKPARITLAAWSGQMGLGETMQLHFNVRPTRASRKVTWNSSDKSVVLVSPEGQVHAVGLGKAYIRVRSSLKPSVFDRVQVTVSDPNKQLSVSIEGAGEYLSPGDVLELRARVEPASADQAVTWRSSRTDVAQIGADGRAVAVAPGSASITATTTQDGLSASVTVNVLGNVRETEIPARYTTLDADEIQKNREKIDAIHNSALSELSRLKRKGVISQAEFDLRKRVLLNAFTIQRFTWYTDRTVPYWSSRYSMGGLKNFRPGRAYYGMPYIQTGFNNARGNRRYNPAKAISEGYFSKGQQGLYRMSTKRQAGRYVGSDCSSYVGMSIFTVKGYSLNSTACAMITSGIAVSTAYQNVESYDDLRPGDVMVWPGEHVVMFLYYTDSAKSRMMIVEQGGGSNLDIHNTVCLSEVYRADYEMKYRPRRAKFLSAR
ncbi:MAG: Ig-like domain-containing protein [Clostridia bacterium]